MSRGSVSGRPTNAAPGRHAELLADLVREVRLRLQSPGDEEATRRYDVEVFGSVSAITVATAG